MFPTSRQAQRRVVLGHRLCFSSFRVMLGFLAQETRGGGTPPPPRTRDLPPPGGDLPCQGPLWARRKWLWTLPCKHRNEPSAHVLTPDLLSQVRLRAPPELFLGDSFGERCPLPTLTVRGTKGFVMSPEGGFFLVSSVSFVLWLDTVKVPLGVFLLPGFCHTCRFGLERISTVVRAWGATGGGAQ